MPQSIVDPTSLNQTMRALVFDGSLRLGTIPRPVATEGEVVVDVVVCGISRADIDMVAGRRSVEISPAVLGHQLVGRVFAQAADIEEDWVGRRVLVQTVPGCRRCSRCRHGFSWQCEKGLETGIGMGRVDGAFAESLCVPASSLVEVREDLEDEEAVFVYPVATVLQALAAIQGPPPQRILVIGDGNMGLLATYMAHAVGHTVSVLGRHPSRRELLWRSGIGFMLVSDETIRRPEKLLAELGEPHGVVIECSGRVDGLELAARCLRPRGQLLLISDHVGQPGARLSFFVAKEIEMVGVGAGPLAPAMEYLSGQAIDLPSLIEARASILDGVSAFERASRRGSLRVLLRNQGGI